MTKYRSYDGKEFDNVFDRDIHDHLALRVAFSRNGIKTYGTNGKEKYSPFLSYIDKIVIPNEAALETLNDVYPVLKDRITSCGTWQRKDNQWKKIK